MIAVSLHKRWISPSMLEELNNWIADLPTTKRNRRAYRIINKNGENRNIPKIVFVRRDDAIAFKIKFGL